MQQRVYLVGHGSRSGTIGGSPKDGPLHRCSRRPDANRLGLRQTTCAPNCHIGADSVRIVASDLVRAFETATIISEMLPVPVATDERLRERHLGVWQGRDCAYTQAWLGLSDEPGRAPDGGESLDDVRRRAHSSLAELDPAHTQAARVTRELGDRVLLTVGRQHTLDYVSDLGERLVVARVAEPPPGAFPP